MNPYSFVLPEAFHPGDFLRSPDLIPRRDDARFFVSLIVTKMAQRDLDRRGLAILHAKFLNKVMHKDTCAKVIEALLDGGVVERFGYKVGERSFGYRLCRRYVSGKHIRVPATDPGLIRRLERRCTRYSSELESRMLPVHRALAKLQSRLRIHGDEARSILDRVVETTKYRHQDSPERVRMCQRILIDDIEQRQFHVNVGTYGRMTNNITSLQREIRTQLHVNGEPLSSLDLSCAQPAFITRLIADTGIMPNATNADPVNADPANAHDEATARNQPQAKQGTGNETKQDQQPSIYDSEKNDPFLANPKVLGERDGGKLQFQQLVETGELYDCLLANLQLRGIETARQKIKKRVLVDVIARGKRYPASDEEIAFREMFPWVSRFIRDFNRLDHGNLIRELQRRESNLVIEVVCADLVARFPEMFMITLHDAVYVRPGDVHRVEQAFEREFDRVGCRMRLKVES